MRSNNSNRLILDKAQPEIARASALPLLPRFETSASEPALRAAIADPDPLVRLAAPRCCDGEALVDCFEDKASVETPSEGAEG